MPLTRDSTKLAVVIRCKMVFNLFAADSFVFCRHICEIEAADKEKWLGVHLLRQRSGPFFAQLEKEENVSREIKKKARISTRPWPRLNKER